MGNSKASYVVLFLIALFSGAPTHADWSTMAGVTAKNGNCFATLGTDLYAGTGSGIFKSPDNGATWSAVNSGLTTKNVTALYAFEGSLFAGTKGGNGVFLSADSGKSWNVASTGITDLQIEAFISIGKTLYVGTDGDGVFITTNHGTSWTGTSNGITDKHMTSFAVSGTNLFAFTDGGPFLSTDSGANWAFKNGGMSAHGIADHTVLTVHGQTVFGGTSSGNFVTTNNGTIWTMMNNGLVNTPAGLDIQAYAWNGADLFCGTELGVYKSSDDGANWAAANTGLTSPPIVSLLVAGPYLFAGTSGNGVWRRPLSELGGSSAIPLPSERQNAVRFSVERGTVHAFFPKRAFASVGIHDLRGNLVATIMKGSIPSGEHVWPLSLYQLPAGRYLISLESEHTKAQQALSIAP